MNEHSFDIEIAKEYGVNCAILLKYIYYWIEKNRANDKHFHDGCYWTYNSIRAFEELFPYMSKNTINRCLKTLVEKGLLIEGNFNSSSYDRTKWYTVTEFAKSILEKCKFDLPKVRNDIYPKSETNTNYIPIKEPNIYKGVSDDSEEKRKKFVPPTPEEIDAYCIEKNYEYVDPYYFFNYYQSNGWKVGRNKMVSWCSTVSNWNRRAIEQNGKKYVRKQTVVPTEDEELALLGYE